jgi:hypothetical protein
MSLLPAVLSTVDFNIAELQACALDGDIHRTGNGYLLSDYPESSLGRAKSLGFLVDERCVLALWSAAWVHSAVDWQPQRHTVALRNGVRLRLPVDLHYDIAELALADSDVWGTAGALFTSPLRTAVDLARFIQDDSRLGPALRRLLHLAHATLNDYGPFLERVIHLPHKQRAYERLAAALAFADPIDVVDGINASNTVQEAV